MSRPVPGRDVPDWTDGAPVLVVERCARCGHRWYFRRERCPSCAAPEVERHVADGRGTVAAVTVLHTGEPVGICLVDLVESVRVLARCPTDLTIGEAVTLEVRDGAPAARRRGGSSGAS